MITVHTADGRVFRNLVTTLDEIDAAIRDPEVKTITLADKSGERHLIVTGQIVGSSPSAEAVNAEGGGEHRSASDVILLALHKYGARSRRELSSTGADWGSAGWSSYPSPSTVTNALSILSDGNLIEQVRDGVWQTTEKGADWAKEMRPI